MGPERIEDAFHRHVLNARRFPYDLLHLELEHRADAAAQVGEVVGDVGLAVVGIYPEDQPKVDYVDTQLRVRDEAKSRQYIPRP